MSSLWLAKDLSDGSTVVLKVRETELESRGLAGGTIPGTVPMHWQRMLHKQAVGHNTGDVVREASMAWLRAGPQSLSFAKSTLFLLTFKGFSSPIRGQTPRFSSTLSDVLPLRILVPSSACDFSLNTTSTLCVCSCPGLATSTPSTAASGSST